MIAFAALAASLLPGPTAAPPRPQPVPATRATARAAGPRRPPISVRFIPFGPGREAQMRAYARRHYGLDTARLTRPRVIVEHITVTPTLRAVIDLFASNRRDAELGERPGVCSHFVVDRDGTIVQLVSLRLMCRHTVGLNHRSIGIEHVAANDGELMADARQLRASRRLTRWLQARYGIRTRDVIGHNESLSSPFHEERVARLRTQTHQDMRPATMRRYRKGL